eukprot:4243734-Lingulodinium_polyedra.AAC.1
MGSIVESTTCSSVESTLGDIVGSIECILVESAVVSMVACREGSVVDNDGSTLDCTMMSTM